MILLPEFDEVVAAPGDEAFHVVWFLSWRLIDQTAWNDGRSPTDCVTADLQEDYNWINNQTQYTLKGNATQKQTVDTQLE